MKLKISSRNQLLAIILILLTLVLGCNRTNRGPSPSPIPDSLQANQQNASLDASFHQAPLIGSPTKSCTDQNGQICNGFEYLESSSTCPSASGSPSPQPGTWQGKVCLPNEFCSGYNWVESNDTEKCCASECLKRVVTQVAFNSLKGENATIEKHSIQETAAMAFTSYTAWLSYSRDMPPEIAAVAGSLAQTSTWQVSRWIYSFAGPANDGKETEFSFIVLNSDDQNLEIAEYTPEIKAYLDSGNCRDDNATLRQLKTEASCPANQAGSIFTPIATELSYIADGIAKKIVCCEVLKEKIQSVPQCLSVGGYSTTSPECSFNSALASYKDSLNSTQYCCLAALDCPTYYTPTVGVNDSMPAGFTCDAESNTSYYAFPGAGQESGYCQSVCNNGCDSGSGKCNSGFCCIKWKDSDGNILPDSESELASLAKRPSYLESDCVVDNPETYDRAATYNGNCDTFNPEDFNQETLPPYVDCKAISSQDECIQKMGYCAPTYMFFGVFYGGCEACPANCDDSTYWLLHTISNYKMSQSYCYCDGSQSNCGDYETEEECANSGERCVPWYTEKDRYYQCGSCPVTCKTSEYNRDWLAELNPCNCIE